MLREPASPYRLPKIATPSYGIGIAGQAAYPTAAPLTAVGIVDSSGRELDRKALILRGNDF